MAEKFSREKMEALFSGKKYGRVTVGNFLREDGKVTKSHRARWIVTATCGYCGHVFEDFFDNIRYKANPSCGCQNRISNWNRSRELDRMEGTARAKRREEREAKARAKAEAKEAKELAKAEKACANAAKAAAKEREWAIRSEAEAKVRAEEAEAKKKARAEARAAKASTKRINKKAEAKSAALAKQAQRASIYVKVDRGVCIGDGIELTLARLHQLWELLDKTDCCPAWCEDSKAFCLWGIRNGYARGKVLVKCEDEKPWHPLNCKWENE